MKTVKVKSRFGREVSTTRITDFDLLYAWPVFLFSVIGHMIFRPIVIGAMNLLGLPLLLAMGKIDRKKGKMIFVLNFISLPLIYGFFLSVPTFAIKYTWLLIIVQVILSMTLIKILKEAQSTYGGISPPQKHTPGGSGFNDFFSENAEKISEDILDSEWSKYLILNNLIVSGFLLYTLLFAFLLQEVNNSLYLSLLFTAFVFIVLLINRPIEHMSAHAPRGRLIDERKLNTGRDKLFYWLENIRKHIVWPLKFWMPGCYRLSHRFNHHRECNSPADSISMLRFDRTSFMGFMKGVVWFSLFTRLLPIDCLRYFSKEGVAFKSNKKVMLRAYLNGYIKGLIVFAIFAVLFPPLAALVLTWVVFSGVKNYTSNLQLHGFQDASKSLSKSMAVCSPIHAGHHFYPDNLHIILNAQHARNFWWMYEGNPNQYRLLISSEVKVVYSKFWLLVEARLWQQKLKIVSNIIATGKCAPSQLARYVEGSKDVKRLGFIDSFDRILSKGIGKFLDVILSAFLSKKAKVVLNSTSLSEVKHKKVNNFYSFKVSDWDDLPPGIY